MEKHQLVKILSDELPGWEAQKRYAPPLREELLLEDSIQYTQAAVLVLIVKGDQNWKVVFIERQSHYSGDKHKGQISFPGGKLENSDASLLACALRETEEEIGVQSTDIEVLGKLSPLKIPVSGFQVHPFLGIAINELTYTADPLEVKTIFTLPVELFSNKHPVELHEVQMANGHKLTTPGWLTENGILWGATAMMVSEFAQCFGKIGS